MPPVRITLVQGRDDETVSRRVAEVARTVAEALGAPSRPCAFTCGKSRPSTTPSATGPGENSTARRPRRPLRPARDAARCRAGSRGVTSLPAPL